MRAALSAGLRATPIVLYMHENQAAYPEGFAAWRGDVGVDADESTAEVARSSQTDEQIDAPIDVQFALTNLTSVLAADLTIWNSDWNKRSFLTGIDRILHHAPDLALRDWPARLQDCSIVIWPPVEPPPAMTSSRRVLHNSAGALDDLASVDRQVNGARAAGAPIRVVWPHRWEHDKGPDELLRIAERYSDEFNLRWTILGEKYRKAPPAMIKFQNRMADRIDHIGFVPDRAEYWRHLASCDWVLSTARHEFFGIGVVESLLAGCLPWLPDRLSYNELLPDDAQGLSPMNPPPVETMKRLRAQIIEHLEPALARQAVGNLDDAIARTADVRPAERSNLPTAQL